MARDEMGKRSSTAHYDPEELASLQRPSAASGSPDSGSPSPASRSSSLALNWGNEGNRDRVRRGFKHGRHEQVHKMLGTCWAKRTWDFVQATSGITSKLLLARDLEAQKMDVNGIEPVKAVERSAVETQVTARCEGGYYPIVYDFEKSCRRVPHRGSRRTRSTSSTAPRPRTPTEATRRSAFRP
jgi:hypothetical protein